LDPPVHTPSSQGITLFGKKVSESICLDVPEESRKLMSRISEGLKLAGLFQDAFEGVPPDQEENASESIVDIAADHAQRTPGVSRQGALTSAEALKQPSVDVVSQNGLLGIPVTIAPDQKLRILPHSANPQLAEHYRIIRTNILQQRSSSAFRTLLVTSPSPQEGKTLTVLNLALTFAMLPSFRVLVVDGDLRNGNLGATLGLKDSLGFSNFIESGAQLEDVILKCDTLPINFMMRGNAKLSPAELLQSPLLGEQIRKLSEHFDLVLIDSPPATMFADTKLLASVCDGILLVARAFSTTGTVLKQVCQDLQQFRIVGAVLNGIETGSYQRYRYYHGMGRDQ
jgi:protein-tyrosine kinase